MGGTITFYACGQDASYVAEHFGVAVSTAGNTSAADFTTIQQWTMTAAPSLTPALNAPQNAFRSTRRAQGNWYQYTVDLSDYAGQTGYVAIRHFGCSDMFILDIDDIELSNGDGAVPGAGFALEGISKYGAVTFTVDGKEVKSVVFTRGQISELLPGLTVGTHRINVYLNDNYNDYFYSNTMQVTVKNKQTPTTPAKKATKITAKKATFKAKKKVKKYTITLKAGKAAVKKVKVTLKIGKKTYKATTNAKGKATFKIKKLTKKGKYNAVVKFAGKGNYLKTSKKVKITIK